MVDPTAAEALSGNFGVYHRTAGYIMRGNVRFEFNSTPLDMVLRSLENGAKVGDILLARGIGQSIDQWKLVPKGGGDRTPDGIWVERIR